MKNDEYIINGIELMGSNVKVLIEKYASTFGYNNICDLYDVLENVTLDKKTIFEAGMRYKKAKNAKYFKVTDVITFYSEEDMIVLIDHDPNFVDTFYEFNGYTKCDINRDTHQHVNFIKKHKAKKFVRKIIKEMKNNEEGLDEILHIKINKKTEYKLEYLIDYLNSNMDHVFMKQNDGGTIDIMVSKYFSWVNLYIIYS